MLKQILARCSNLLEPVHVAETREELEAVYRFRYSVYFEEFGRELGTPDHERRWVTDPDDEKEYSTILYTGSLNSITGTVRLRHWRAGEVPHHDFEELSMDRIPGIEERRTGEIGRLMIRPTARGKLVIAALLRASYDLFIEEHATELCFCYCSPGLVRYYQKLAMRPFGGRLVHAPDGLMVPLVAVMSDVDYYREARSLLLPRVRHHFGNGQRERLDMMPYRALFAPGERGIEFEPELVSEAVGRALPPIPGAPACPLLADLPQESIDAITARGLVIDVEPGTLVTRKGFHEEEVYLILDGSFEATDEGRYLRTMEVGEFFGEMAFFEPEKGRTASVEAMTAGCLLVLRGSPLRKLMRRDAVLGETLNRRLAGAMMDRVRSVRELGKAA